MVRNLVRAAAALVVLALSATAANAAAPISVITRPDWLEKPTGEDLSRFFPQRAADEYVGGKATIVCTVNADGRLIDCVVDRETPEGYGFGDAALSLSAMFRMKPKTIDGAPVDGGKVTIPLVFNVPPRPALGDMAIVLTTVNPAMRPLPPDALVMSCPTSADECLGHFFEWTSRPDKTQSARILALATLAERGAGAARGTGAMCVVAPDGALKDCQFAGDLSEGNRAAAQESVKLLRAPKKTADGVTTAGTLVLIPFNWRELAAKP